MGCRPFLTSLALLSTIVLASSLKCNKDTGLSCKKSVFVTGVCEAGQCQCVDGYRPTEYGCQEKIKVEIVAEDAIRLEGGNLQLHCTPNSDEEIFNWYKDGKIIEGAKRTFFLKYDIQQAVDSGTYECSVTVDGEESDRSEPFSVNFVHNESDKNSYRKPVLRGVPEYQVDGLRAPMIVCDAGVVPGNLRAAYTFYMAGEAVYGPSRQSSWRLWHLSKTLTGKTGPLSCSVTYGSVTLSSDEVPYPDGHRVELAVSGPRYKAVGKSLTFYCETSDTRSIGGVTGKNVSWTKDETPLGEYKQYDYSIKDVKAEDGGAYRCHVTREDGAVWSSPPRELRVVTAEVTITPSTTEIFPNTSLTLECESRVTEDIPVLYNWRLNWETIKGQTDKTLHVQDLKEHNNDRFRCEVGWTEKGDKIDNFLASSHYIVKLTPEKN